MASDRDFDDVLVGGGLELTAGADRDGTDSIRLAELIERMSAPSSSSGLDRIAGRIAEALAAASLGAGISGR